MKTAFLAVVAAVALSSAAVAKEGSYNPNDKPEIEPWFPECVSNGRVDWGCISDSFG